MGLSRFLLKIYGVSIVLHCQKRTSLYAFGSEFGYAEHRCSDRGQWFPAETSLDIRLNSQTENGQGCSFSAVLVGVFYTLE